MTTSAEKINEAIYAAIPLSHALQFQIQAVDEEAIFASAPLEPNINMHGSAFAGSIYAIAALTAWSFVTHLCGAVSDKSSVVIGKAEIFYKKPILESVQCRSSVSVEEREAFLHAFSNEGKSRLELEVAIGQASEAVLQATVFATT